MLVDTGDERIGVADVDHHGGEIVVVLDEVFRLGDSYAVPLAKAEQFFDIEIAARSIGGRDDVDTLEGDPQVFGCFGYGLTDPSRMGRAMASSTIACEARMIFSCSPSGNTTRLGAASRDE